MIDLARGGMIRRLLVAFAVSCLATSSLAAVTAVPPKVALDRITLAAFTRFEAANSLGGMNALTEAVRGCYRHATAPPAVMQCLQLDWFARTYDVAFDASIAKDAEAAQQLRTPYFADEAFKARRDVHIQDLGSEPNGDLDAALLIHARNALDKKLGSGGSN